MSTVSTRPYVAYRDPLGGCALEERAYAGGVIPEALSVESLRRQTCGT